MTSFMSPPVNGVRRHCSKGRANWSAPFKSGLFRLALSAARQKNGQPVCAAQKLGSFSLPVGRHTDGVFFLRQSGPPERSVSMREATETGNHVMMLTGIFQ